MAALVDGATEALDCSGRVSDAQRAYAGEAHSDKAFAAGARSGLIQTTEQVLTTFGDRVELPIKPGERVRVPLRLKPAETLLVGLRVTAPADAKPGTTFTVDAVQREGETAVGGVAAQVRVVKP